MEAASLLEELRKFDNKVYGVAHGLLLGSRKQVWGLAGVLFDEVARMDHSTAAAFYNALADVLWHFGQVCVYMMAISTYRENRSKFFHLILGYYKSMYRDSLPLIT